MNWQSLQRRTWARWLAAFCFWSVIVLFYSTSNGRMGQETTWTQSFLLAATQWYVWALLAPFIIRFDRRLPVAPEAVGQRILFHMPACFLFTTVYVFVSAWARDSLGVAREPFSLSMAPLTVAWRGMFHWNVLVYWVIFGGYAAYDYYRSLREGELRAVELERLLAESRLEALRAQLHPHFLFNALNAISAHVEREPRIARRMLEQLGELLRLTLDHCEAQEIPLEREAAFLDRYLAIQKVRFEDRLETRVRIEPETLDAMLPTFLLQPLVENAIKHGVSLRSAKSTVGVEAWREDGMLRLQVWDDGPGLPKDWDPEHPQGMGIANTRERLRRLYGESGHSFQLANNRDGGVTADISLPLRLIREPNAAYTSSAR